MPLPFLSSVKSFSSLRFYLKVTLSVRGPRGTSLPHPRLWPGAHTVSWSSWSRRWLIPDPVIICFIVSFCSAVSVWTTSVLLAIVLLSAWHSAWQIEGSQQIHVEWWATPPPKSEEVSQSLSHFVTLEGYHLTFFSLSISLPIYRLGV